MDGNGSHRPVRIAHCSGSTATASPQPARCSPGPIDVLTGDYLAELTMLILLALNFVVVGLLAPGVAATTRPDAQAKGLGEYLRSRTVLVPAELIEEIEAKSSWTTPVKPSACSA
jgi:hypothetical protein